MFTYNEPDAVKSLPKAQRQLLAQQAQLAYNIQNQQQRPTAASLAVQHQQPRPFHTAFHSAVQCTGALLSMSEQDRENLRQSQQEAQQAMLNKARGITTRNHTPDNDPCDTAMIDRRAAHRAVRDTRTDQARFKNVA